MVPKQTLSKAALDDFLDIAGQFKRDPGDSGMMQLKQLSDDALFSQARKAGMIEKYAFLLTGSDQRVLRDITLRKVFKSVTVCAVCTRWLTRLTCLVSAAQPPPTSATRPTGPNSALVLQPF